MILARPGPVTKEIDVAMNLEIRNQRLQVSPILRRHCEKCEFLLGERYADLTRRKASFGLVAATLRRRKYSA